MSALVTARVNQAPLSIRARWATVRVETEDHVYVGRLYVPETKKRVSEVLSDERLFINLTEVAMDDSHETESYVAINKRYIRTIRVLDEGRPEVVMPPLRMS